MAYINKLDTNALTVTINALGVRIYISTPCTVELNNVAAYFTYVEFNGTVTSYTSLLLTGVALPVIVDEPYTTIDLLINP